MMIDLNIHQLDLIADALLCYEEDRDAASQEAQDNGELDDAVRHLMRAEASTHLFAEICRHIDAEAHR